MQILDRINNLIKIGVALSAEKDLPRLLEMILVGAKAITNADGGTIYTVQDDQTLKMEIVRTDSLDFAMGGTTGTEIPFEPIPMYDPDGNPLEHMVVTYSVLNDSTVNIADAYETKGFDFSGTREFDQKTGYRSRSFLTVPMKNHESKIIGVLQLINAQDEENDEIIPFSSELQQLTEAIASQAAIALTNRQLIDSLEQMFVALIRMLAKAIDKKSPHTGNHSRRVPVITMMLAKAASSTTSGPLKDFKMTDADIHELETAAWLHDCGKVSTPEYVVDKRTKLETIHDAIHEVGCRFEILRRDLEIKRLRQLAKGGESADQIDSDYQQRLAELDDEQQFIERANIGGEFMTDEDQARVREIGKRELIINGEQRPLLDERELYNLTIAKGTLTPEERDVINKHVSLTISMLESIPFPKHLEQVPLYAGAHHEKINGSGYPRGLSGDQLPIQARIMAIADIFEALTNKRPYKPAKQLSETMKILGFMRKDGEIDGDLLDLFIEQKLYLKYAHEYLDPEQIDEVDHAFIPGYCK
ncbi:phosphohydrolase [Solemya pervernicosa gill symbiont]|uniref:Phosphohydrolase n=1 Tax=Solemya pervernicosa gill symbiont TaxID=642797 RepID=A0A1T2L003_9GAMM|nr:HD family phosphohydrolase [Solemya pervernicosa gill symbiont]OOZ38306.1 phosphohydrolase [Solemya pervernicosa gill symbiont]